jgi:hypothetical protein
VTPSARGGLPAAVLAVAALALTSCGGKAGTPTAGPDATQRVQPGAQRAAELKWRRQAERFVAGLALELARLRAATGGSARAGPVGNRIDPRVLVGGTQRQSFVGVTAALGHCAADLAAAAPQPPTARLQPVRTALANACVALASVARLLEDAVRAAGSSGHVYAGALDVARGQAQEGVQTLVDALTTLRRVLPAD